MENSHRPVFINLLSIARYDHMPDYPIQFMTVGKLFYQKPGHALIFPFLSRAGGSPWNGRVISTIPWFFHRDSDMKGFIRLLTEI